LERVFTLWANGYITIEVIEESRSTGKALVFNQVTGTPGGNPTEFSEARWGERTKYYAACAAGMKIGKFLKVCELAKEYAQTTARRSDRSTSTQLSSQPEALLEDLDSDENCKSFPFFTFYTTHRTTIIQNSALV
jgi:hypothetical protein